MIEFGCENCGRYFKVADDKEGKRGKCPDCGNGIRVPQKEKPFEFEGEFSHDPVLEELSDVMTKLARNSSCDILYCKSASKESLLVGVDCGNGRTQNILIVLGFVSNKKYILMNSVIGNYFLLLDQHMFFDLAVECADNPLIQLNASSDGEIAIRKFIELPVTDMSFLVVYATETAKFADQIEEKYFSEDLN